MLIRGLHIFLLIFNLNVIGQEKEILAEQWVWNPDNGNGTYTNPIINSDYSDPDVIRVDDKFYMTASSFNCSPGLPILESYDLVNWNLVGYAIQKQIPLDYFDKVQHGKGVWAPCLRYHNKEFYIFYPDPDFGIYMIKSSNPTAKWSDPILIKAGKGLIDPTPLWDNDGKAYLVHAFAGSRAGIKNMLVVSTMNSEATQVNSDEVLIIDGYDEEPTIEGPKIYKRNDYYYIFAPAGGVATGWQTVLRSKNIYGPYEKKKVLDQGNTTINGPHQGAWIQTKTGEDWFIHFQDKEAFGRVVHLQPMTWKNNWPIIGIDEDNNGVGEPVITYKKPTINKSYPKISPLNSDEFNEPHLKLQWQWHANSQINWGFPSSLGYYTLNCIPKPIEAINLYDIPNLLLQKFPHDSFSAIAKVSCNFHFDNEEAGFVIMGLDYCYLKIKKEADKYSLTQIICKNADKKGIENKIEEKPLKSNTIYIKVEVDTKANCTFSYSEDGQNFNAIGTSFTAKEGKWIGAKLGFVALRENFINDAGNMKIDWIRFN
jgi:beta-xylosidase